INCSSARAAMAVTESNYIELMKSCSKFNARITGERKTRYPFFDQQTGTAHRPSAYAWRRSEHRYASKDPDYVYSYPAIKWRRDPSAPPSDATEMKMFLHNNQPLTDAINHAQSYGAPATMPTSMGNLEAMAMMSNAESTMMEASHHSGGGGGGGSERSRGAGLKREAAAYEDYDEDPFEDGLSDDGGDSDDDFGSKRKKGKGGGGHPASAKKKKASGGPTGGQVGGGSAASSAPTATPTSGNAAAAEEKRHACNKCGARYKSRPGLSYHKAHVHGDGVQAPANVLAGGDAGSGGSGSSGSGGAKGRRGAAPPPIEMPPMGGVGGGAGCPSPAVLPPPVIFSPSVDISDTCDFCDGTRLENKKTKQPEELVTCHDCGRSGHPSCLNFTENMRLSTSKFGWQCIECKSCAICGTSDNDDKLLFCDDCDRGFHLYCLQPPLEQAPDDAWSCHLCMKVFGAKAAAAQAKK
ncbi:hypothetical protein PENTCL1PPCAC_8971, partial [Pristionchus entomophagus]